MTFFGALYKILIGPLELFFEIIFVIATRLLDNLGLAIIALSLVMNFLVLPLYRRADAMQEEQRETEKRLKKWVTHIKKTFKGDERFMMLQTYYRQNNYKPSSILKGSVSLLLEIPFFIAAYNFLSHAGVFNGFSFGPFIDMGQPDGLIKIAGLSINLLPILMTAINIVSSMIYTKGLPASSKVQLYGMAAIFLVLLYDSPACLVFYWTLNNLFSLVKNLFYKLKNPKLVLSIIGAISGICALLFDIVHPFNTLKKNIFVIGAGIILLIPLCVYFLKKYIKIPVSKREVELTKTDKIIYWIGTIFLALLTGLLIPSAVINSSPEEFINTVTFASPLNYILQSILIAIGTFIVWFGIFYKLASDKGKKVFGLLISIISICSLVNYLFFGNKLGTLSPLLVYVNNIRFSKLETIINIFVVILITVAIYFIWKKKETLIKSLLIIAVISVFGMGIFNTIHTKINIKNKSEKLETMANEKPSFTLSKNGKNVIVLMMDRAISIYIPYIFNEKPEVARQFEGFTYYPNTISFGGWTNFGAPALYGGYEYRTSELNKRDSEFLKDKHDEALKIMPVVFDKNGYNVTVFDPTYAGYEWIPDLSIYDDYPSINKFITMGYVNDNNEASELKNTEVLNRNFFLFSIVKILPCVIQPTIYNRGNYNSINVIAQVLLNSYKAIGFSQNFIKPYKVLQNLSTFTKIEENSQNNFLMMSNDTTHEPSLLQEPAYEPKFNVDNTEYEKNNKSRFYLAGQTLEMKDSQQISHYQINMAAMIQLGKYFDFLRENNVWDNTKIIIVADHGRSLHHIHKLVMGDKITDDIMLYNPLLMVKDFNHNSFNIDMQFMTNADTPTIAFKDLIDNPINPFTNKKINSEPKKDKKQYIIASDEWDVNTNNGKTYLPSYWYSVHDNIFDLNNWEKIE